MKTTKLPPSTSMGMSDSSFKRLYKKKKVNIKKTKKTKPIDRQIWDYSESSIIDRLNQIT